MAHQTCFRELRIWDMIKILNQFPLFFAKKNLKKPITADVPSRRRLRSASTDQLLVPSYQRSTIGPRAFPIAGARVWNALPSDVTSAPSLAVFGRRLKTELFRRCYNAA